jgi:hypothetical protein
VLDERDEQHVPLFVLPFTWLELLKIDDLLLELVLSDCDILRDPTTILADPCEVGRREQLLEEVLARLTSRADEKCGLTCKVQHVRLFGVSLGDKSPSCHFFAIRAGLL